MCVYLRACMHKPMHIISMYFEYVHIKHMRIYRVAHLSAWYD